MEPDATAPAGDAMPRPRRSLSRRVLWFTFGVMLVTELLVFLPTLAAERGAWLRQRVAAAEIAVLAAPSEGRAAGPDGQARRRELLRLVGVLSVRLQEPGRPFVQLAEVGQVEADRVEDLRDEGLLEAIGQTVHAAGNVLPERLLVIAPSEQRLGAVLSVVMEGAPLGRHLRGMAGQIALQGLAVAAASGALIYWALVLLLVRPMRRLTGSITAFRADPERTPPMETPQAVQDEIALAAAELAAMQRELRGALWRNARLAAIGTAVAKVSHDLRGILSPALISAERLQASGDDRVRAAGDAIARAVERATDLVRRTLDFAREDPSLPHREALAVRDIAEEAAEQVRAAHPALSVQNLIPATRVLRADRMHLLRILGNLIRNAAEAGARTIRLDANQEGEVLWLTVEDDGPGLPLSVQRGLFRPFVSGGRRGGSGLGLAIAYDLIRAHGGDIVLVATGAGGTAFRLTLPQPAEILPG